MPGGKGAGGGDFELDGLRQLGGGQRRQGEAAVEPEGGGQLQCLHGVVGHGGGGGLRLAVGQQPGAGAAVGLVQLHGDLGHQPAQQGPVQQQGASGPPLVGPLGGLEAEEAGYVGLGSGHETKAALRQRAACAIWRSVRIRRQGAVGEYSGPKATSWVRVSILPASRGTRALRR